MWDLDQGQKQPNWLKRWNCRYPSILLLPQQKIHSSMSMLHVSSQLHLFDISFDPGGFTVADSLEEIADNSIHVGALLNVLDRCDNPIDLVRAMLQKLRQATSEQYDGGYLMIGIVMPFKGGQVLEGTWGNDGKSASRRPRNRLVLPSITATKKRKGWTEFQAAHFYAGLLHHIPQLEVVRWTRLPYVSIGGIQFTHSTLDMVLMVLRRPRSGTNNNNDSTETVPLPEGENEIESVGKDGSEDPAEMDKTEL